jgi:thioredoxin 1
MVLSVGDRTFSTDVLDSSLPVLVHFWAPWCGLCRMINPVLVQFQSEWEGKIKLVGINADENFKLANTYRLTSLPTLILFERGSAIYRIDDFRGRDDLRKDLNNIMTNLVAQSA